MGFHIGHLRLPLFVLTFLGTEFMLELVELVFELALLEIESLLEEYFFLLKGLYFIRLIFMMRYL